jgi:hypothetical protein
MLDSEKKLSLSIASNKINKMFNEFPEFEMSLDKL